MRLRTLLLLLLLMPGLALGPGWSLRICAQGLPWTQDCCTEVSVASCCPSEGDTPLDPATGMASACDRCCIHITTLYEQPVPSPEPLVHVVERTQAAALAIAISSTDLHVAHVAFECSTRAASAVPRATPDRCAPLPLRI